MLKESEIQFINQSLQQQEPFALIQLPECNERLLWSARTMTDRDSNSLVISPWLTAYGDSVFNLNCNRTHSTPIPTRSTSKDEYLCGVKNVIDSCRDRDGKTVYSRVKCGEIEQKDSWGEIASRLFDEFENTCRFIFYTPQLGGWLGATPELILDMDKRTGIFHTMALAGTRQYREGIQPWDDKNIKEHRYVVDYILDRLQNKASNLTLSEEKTLRYGNIEHLLHTISGCADPSQIECIMDTLSPTPALCGYPYHAAVKDICENESHSRGCYGGYIAVETSERFQAYVILRSLQFSGHRYCLYGGGGITGDSDPEEEYNETINKMSKILSILKS